MSELIDRQDAIDALCKNGLEKERNGQLVMAMCEAKQWAIDTIEQLPSAQPEIIRCRECKFCKFASDDSRICMKFGHSPIGELDFCSFAERREVNNESD